MKNFILIIILTILLIASAVTGYQAARSWNNPLLANSCLLFFALFWAFILYLSFKIKPVDSISQEIEDRNYTPENVNQ